MEPPLFPARGLHTVRAAPGSDACLVLPPPSGTPPFHYEWSRAGASLDDRFTSSDDAGGVRLTVTAAGTGDSGVYTLQASNAAGRDTARVRLEVAADETPTGDDPPTFLRRLQDLTVKVGTRTRFLVEIVSSTECKVTWYRNERRLMEAERVSLARDGNFWCADVAAVSVDDAGRWTCTAENAGGRASCSAHLNVLVPKAYKRPEFVEELRALLTEQGTVSLECKVVGVPTPVLRWFKDSREIKAGDVFALTANAEDPTSLGTYTCEAVNCMGRAYSSSKVHVVGRASREGSAKPSSSGITPDPPPIFTKELEDQFVRICEHLTLSCQIVVPPWPRSVVWYNKEGKVEPGERYHVVEDGVGGYLLEVPSAEWPDEGEWKCVATSAGGRVGISSCYVSMDVPKNYRKPRFMENLQAVLTEEGLVSFECKVVGFPTPVLSWFKDGQELKPGDVYQLTGTNSLGSYCCIARNCMGQASSSAELTVEDIQNQLNEEEKLQLFPKNQAPKFLQGLKSVEAKIDEPFRFTIKVAIPPEPSVLWYRDDQPVDETTRCHLGKEERGVFYLDIQNLEFLDQAEWKCVAMNDFGHSVTSCFLKLIIPRHYKKPRFLENLQAILSDEGAVNLECKVIGVPQPVLKWYKDGEELKPGDIHRIISGQDGTCCLGTYTCEAQNCMGIAASSASLLGFDDSMKAKSKKKTEEQALQRNLSLSTIHEERTSQMYDTPVGDITLDDKGEISFSFDGKEVSVSLYETPDLTEEEALQIVEMYADQLSENVTEHNVVELPPLRFVKETSTSGNLLMEAIIIDVSPEYFASPEEDLRTEADIEDISIADENGPPQLSLDQDIGGEDYLEKTMALLSDEKSDIPKKTARKKSDSQKSADDFYSLSRDQSLSEEKRDDDDTQVFSESDLPSFASARSLGKPKSKSSKPSLEEGQGSSELTKTILYKDEAQKPAEPETKPKRERRSSRSSRRSSSGSEKSLSRKEELLKTQTAIEPPTKKVAMTNEEFKTKMNKISSSLSKIINDVQIIERDIILKSELMSSAATASRSLEIISSLIKPLSEIHSIADAAKEAALESKEVSSTLFSNLPQPFKTLQQSLTIIEKCIDVESDSKTLVKKTCVAFIETCSEEMKNLLNDFISITDKNYLLTEQKTLSEIDSLISEINTVIRFSADTIKARNLLTEASEFKAEEMSVETKHLKDTQKAVFELKSPLNSLLCIIDTAEIGKIDSTRMNSSEVLLNNMSASVQDLQAALEQIEALSVKESTTSLQKYNTEIIETVMESVLNLRSSFEQLSQESKNEDKILLKNTLNSIKNNLTEISSQIETIEKNVGSFDILQSENKLEMLQKMAQILITLENNLPRLEIMPEIKTHMDIFHKNLTKVLENVIESNESKKYFTLMEICNAVNRLNSSINSISSDSILSLASINNTLRIVQDTFVKNVFESELNCSILTNITDVLLSIQEALNHAEEISLQYESEHIQDISTPIIETTKAKVILEQIDRTISVINTVKSLEATKEISWNMAPTLESICPVLEELKRNIAGIKSANVLEDEHISEISETSVAKTLATPLLELNQNILTLNQVMIENIESIKENTEIITAVAEPLHELHTTLQIMQQDVISQYDEDITPYDVSVNIASAVQNLQSCMLMIQEQAGVEGIDEMSTLEDISGIKTIADIIPSDRLVLPTAAEIKTEESIEPFCQELATSATAQALHTLNEHIAVLQTPEVIDALDTLSEVSDYSSLKSVALGLGELHSGIEEILHPFIMETSEEMANLINVSKLAMIAEPMQELHQSLSIIDTNNIPIFENILEMPTEKLHAILQNISEFKEHLGKCIQAVFPAMETADKTIEISNKVEALREVCEHLKDIIKTTKTVSVQTPMKQEVIILEETVDNLLDATDVTKGIQINQVKSITEQLYEKVIGVQEELIQFAPYTPEKLAEEAKLIQAIDDIENNIAVLEQYDFVDLSRVSDLTSCATPQLAIELETDSLTQMDDILQNAVNVVQDTSQETPVADLMILEDFFKTCKNEFTILRYIISKPLTHKKIIRLIQEFSYLQNAVHEFKSKRSELRLSSDIDGYLKTFFIQADENLNLIKDSLIKVLDSQQELLFKGPIAKLETFDQVLKTKPERYTTGPLKEVIEKFVMVTKMARPLIQKAELDIIEEMKQPSKGLSYTEHSDLVDKLDETVKLIEEFSLIESLKIEDREIIKSILKCMQKHQEYKDAIGAGKHLIILKCLSECADIIQSNIPEREDVTKIPIVRGKKEENALKSVLTEMLEPLQALHKQLAYIQDQVSTGLDEELISVDMVSTESIVEAMTEIHKNIVEQIESVQAPVNNDEMSLIMEADKEIHVIQDTLKSIENVPTIQELKELTKPIEDIEKSLHIILSSEKVEKESLEKLDTDVNSNIDSLESALDRFLNIESDLLASMEILLDIDIKESLRLALEIKNIMMLNFEEYEKPKIISLKTEKITLLKTILSKFDWLNTEKYLECKKQSEVERLKRIFLTTYQLLAELNQIESYFKIKHSKVMEKESSALLQHIDQYIELIEIVEEISAVIKIEDLKETANIARELRESLTVSEVETETFGDLPKKQEDLAHKLQKALSTLQVQIFDSAQELAPEIRTEITQRIAKVTAQLQCDLAAVTGIQMAIVAPSEDTIDIEKLETPSKFSETVTTLETTAEITKPVVLEKLVSLSGELEVKKGEYITTVSEVSTEQILSAAEITESVVLEQLETVEQKMVPVGEVPSDSLETKTIAVAETSPAVEILEEVGDLLSSEKLIKSTASQSQEPDGQVVVKLPETTIEKPIDIAIEQIISDEFKQSVEGFTSEDVLEVINKLSTITNTEEMKQSIVIAQELRENIAAFQTSIEEPHIETFSAIKEKQIQLTHKLHDALSVIQEQIIERFTDLTPEYDKSKLEQVIECTSTLQMNLSSVVASLPEVKVHEYTEREQVEVKFEEELKAAAEKVSVGKTDEAEPKIVDKVYKEEEVVSKTEICEESKETKVAVDETLVALEQMEAVTKEVRKDKTSVKEDKLENEKSSGAAEEFETIQLTEQDAATGSTAELAQATKTYHEELKAIEKLLQNFEVRITEDILQSPAMSVLVELDDFTNSLKIAHNLRDSILSKGLVDNVYHKEQNQQANLAQQFLKSLNNIQTQLIKKQTFFCNTLGATKFKEFKATIVTLDESLKSVIASSLVPVHKKMQQFIENEDELKVTQETDFSELAMHQNEDSAKSPEIENETDVIKDRLENISTEQNSPSIDERTPFGEEQSVVMIPFDSEVDKNITKKVDISNEPEILIASENIGFDTERNLKADEPLLQVAPAVVMEACREAIKVVTATILESTAPKIVPRLDDSERNLVDNSFKTDEQQTDLSHEDTATEGLSPTNIVSPEMQESVDQTYALEKVKFEKLLEGNQDQIQELYQDAIDIVDPVISVEQLETEIIAAQETQDSFVDVAGEIPANTQHLVPFVSEAVPSEVISTTLKEQILETIINITEQNFDDEKIATVSQDTKTCYPLIIDSQDVVESCDKLDTEIASEINNQATPNFEDMSIKAIAEINTVIGLEKCDDLKNISEGIRADSVKHNDDIIDATTNVGQEYRFVQHDFEDINENQCNETAKIDSPFILEQSETSPTLRTSSVVPEEEFKMDTTDDSNKQVAKEETQPNLIKDLQQEVKTTTSLATEQFSDVDTGPDSENQNQSEKIQLNVDTLEQNIADGNSSPIEQNIANIDSATIIETEEIKPDIKKDLNTADTLIAIISEQPSSADATFDSNEQDGSEKTNLVIVEPIMVEESTDTSMIKLPVTEENKSSIAEITAHDFEEQVKSENVKSSVIEPVPETTECFISDLSEEPTTNVIKFDPLKHAQEEKIRPDITEDSLMAAETLVTTVSEQPVEISTVIQTDERNENAEIIIVEPITAVKEITGTSPSTGPVNIITVPDINQQVEIEEIKSDTDKNSSLDSKKPPPEQKTENVTTLISDKQVEESTIKSDVTEDMHKEAKTPKSLQQSGNEEVKFNIAETETVIKESIENLAEQTVETVSTIDTDKRAEIMPRKDDAAFNFENQVETLTKSDELIKPEILQIHETEIDKNKLLQCAKENIQGDQTKIIMGSTDLLQNLEELVSFESIEVLKDLSKNIDSTIDVKEIIETANELRDNILVVNESVKLEEASSFTEDVNENQAQLIEKLKQALSVLQTSLIDSTQDMVPDQEKLERVTETVMHLQEHLSYAIASVETGYAKCEVTEETTREESMKQLQCLLQEVSEKIDLSTSDRATENTESLRDSLDEVQTIIIKLKRDFDGAANDTLNETLEDLECSVRSVQLQINEDSPPDLLKEACATLLLLVNNMSDTHDVSVSETITKEITSQDVLDKCSSETEQTVQLLEIASNVDIAGRSHLNDLVSSLNNLRNAMKSLKSGFTGTSDTLIEKGIEVIHNLDQIEEKVFSIEREVESEENLPGSIRDSIITAVHSVYGSISNMRSTVSSIQKQFMFENYGKPSENFLRSIKQLSSLQSKTNEEPSKTTLKKLSRSLRNVLNHFEDIKFYINLDKTARLPSDAAFTKIILEELKSNIISIKNIADLNTQCTSKINDALNCVELKLGSIEERSTLEVKEKIPIFKDISVQILNFTSALKSALECKQEITETQKMELRHEMLEEVQLLEENLKEQRTVLPEKATAKLESIEHTVVETYSIQDIEKEQELTIDSALLSRENAKVEVENELSDKVMLVPGIESLTKLEEDLAKPSTSKQALEKNAALKEAELIKTTEVKDEKIVDSGKEDLKTTEHEIDEEQKIKRQDTQDIGSELEDIVERKKKKEEKDVITAQEEEAAKEKNIVDKQKLDTEIKGPEQEQKDVEPEKLKQLAQSAEGRLSVEELKTDVSSTLEYKENEQVLVEEQQRILEEDKLGTKEKIAIQQNEVALGEKSELKEELAESEIEKEKTPKEQKVAVQVDKELKEERIEQIKDQSEEIPEETMPVPRESQEKKGIESELVQTKKESQAQDVGAELIVSSEEKTNRETGEIKEQEYETNTLNQDDVRQQEKYNDAEEAKQKELLNKSLQQEQEAQDKDAILEKGKEDYDKKGEKSQKENEPKRLETEEQEMKKKPKEDQDNLYEQGQDIEFEKGIQFTKQEEEKVLDEVENKIQKGKESQDTFKNEERERNEEEKAQKEETMRSESERNELGLLEREKQEADSKLQEENKQLEEAERLQNEQQLLEKEKQETERKLHEEGQQKEEAESLQKQKQEAEMMLQEENQQKDEAERLQKEKQEAERKLQEEKLQKEEAERIQKEKQEADIKLQEENQQKEEAERLQKEKQEAEGKLQEEKQQKEDAERLQKEKQEAERKLQEEKQQKEGAERLQKEKQEQERLEKEKQEAERKIQEEKQRKDDAERLQKEKQEAERKLQEEKQQKEDAERLQKEKQEAERKLQEENQQKEDAERLQKEKQEAERKLQKEKQQKEDAERLQKEKQEAKRKLQEEKQQKEEAERLQKEKQEAERKLQEENQQKEEAERLQKEKQEAERKLQEENQQKEEAERLQKEKQEAERKLQEEKQQKEEAERLQKEKQEAERKLQEEKQQKEEAERLQKEKQEAERKLQEEKQQKEDAERLQKEKQEAKRKLQEEKQQKEEAERLQKEKQEAERKLQEENQQKEEAERLQKEKQEAERKLQEEKQQKEEAERLQKEKQEAERKLQEEKQQKEEAERLQKEKQEAERKLQEEKQQKEDAERLQKEKQEQERLEKEKQEAERKLQEEKQQKEDGERLQKEKQEAERKLQEEKQQKEDAERLQKEKQEAERKLQEENQQKEEAERLKKKKQKAERKLQEEKQQKEEAERLQKEKQEAERKLQEEKQQKEEAERLHEEKQEQERLEKEKQEAERKLQEEKQQKEDGERLQKEKQEAERKLQEEKQQKEDAERLQKEKQGAERKLQEENQQKEEAERLKKKKQKAERKLQEEKQQKEEAERLQKEKQEAERKLQEEKQQKEEAERLQKEKQEVERKLQEENQQKEEAERLQKENQEADRKLQEEKQQKEDAERLQKEKQEAERKLQEEKLQKEEAERLQKKKQKAERKLQEEKQQKEEAERLQKEKQEAERKLQEEKQQKEDAERLQKEKQEAERKLQEEKQQKEEAERLQKEKQEAEKKLQEENQQKEEAERLKKKEQKAERKLQEEKQQKEEAERLQKEKQEAERKLQEEKQQKEDAERLQKEKQETERMLQEEKQQKEEAERLQKEKQEAERKLQEEKQQKEDAERLQKEKQEAERKLQEEKQQKEGAERLQKEKQEQERLEKEKQEAERKIQEEKQQKEEAERLQKEKQEAERKLQEEKQQKEEAERLQQEKQEQERLDKEKQEAESKLIKEKQQKENAERLEKEKQEKEKEDLLKQQRKEEKLRKKKEKDRLDMEKQESEKKRKEDNLLKQKQEEKLKLQKEKEQYEQLEKDETEAEKTNKEKQEALKEEKKQSDADKDRKKEDEESEAIFKIDTKKLKNEEKETAEKLIEKERQEADKKYREDVRMKRQKEESEQVEKDNNLEKNLSSDTNLKEEENAKRNVDMKFKREEITENNYGISRTRRDKTTIGNERLDVENREENRFLSSNTTEHYIKEYQYEPTGRPKYEAKEKPRFIDHNHRDYTMEFIRPSGYREKSFHVDKFAHERDRADRSPTFYKAGTLVLDAQLRSSAPPQPDINQVRESVDRRSEARIRSKALSEARSILSEKRTSVPRDIKRKPVFSTYLTDRTAVEGSRVKLTCSVLSSTDPKVTWYKNGVILDNKLKYRTKIVDGLITLEVLNAVPSDSAEYSCTVENDNGSVSTSANLKVYPSFEASPIPPTFTRSIRDTYHLAENELVLECRIRGQPLPTITWLKDEKPVSGNERFQAYYLADGVCRLAISHPTPEDSGKYTCKAENSVWSDQIAHVVNFTGKESRLSPNIATIERSRFNRQALESRRPHFGNVLTDYKVTTGGTIGLQVEIKGAPTRVEWLREGKSVVETYSNARTFVEHGLYTLALSDVTEGESGLYTCRAWNNHGTVDMNAAITVVQPNELDGKPAIIVGRPEKDILISVGEDINISFRVQGEPKPKVIFMKGMRDITNNQRVCKMTSDDYVKFTVKRSVISDAGTYCILARNAYGCDRAFVTVVVRQRASSENLISDWTYPIDDSALSIAERNYKSVPERIPSEPSVVDGGSNWVSLAWPKPDPRAAAPVLAYKVESWLVGKEGGARWAELGITPLNSFDAFNLKQGEEYHFRVTPRNRYGWGESVQTSTPIGVGLAGDRPEFVEILPGQLKVLIGQTANLSCSVKGKPTPEIIWMKNGHEIEEEDRRVTSSFDGYNCSLTINDINIEDEARYSCEASNTHGRASTYARLAVVTDRLIWEADAKLKRERSADVAGEYPPQFTMRLRDRRVQVTYPVRLTCQVVGSPPPTVTWYKDGEEIATNGRHNKSQDEHFHTLEIAPTTLDDGGVYEAMARNSCGAVSCRCSLVVDKGIRAYVAPEFCCGLEPLYRLDEGEELRISAVVEAYPSVGVTWYRDGVRLRPSRRAVMTLDRDGQIELALAAVTPRDSGVYTCTASNEVGRATTSGKVEVIGDDTVAVKKKTPPILLSPDVPYSKEPMFIRKPRSSEAREGDTVIIQCEVVGDPKPDVYWLRDFLKPDYYRDATHFKRVGDGPEYRFEIPHAKLDYTGAYSVVARNVHGEAKAIISLQILAKDPSSTEEHNVRYGRVDVIPRFERELTDLLCHDGDAVEFECRVSGNPEPDIRWFHYTELIRECPDFEWAYEEGTARLKIKQVTAEDEGTYLCEASNTLGKATSSACLVVYPPGEPNTLSQRLRRPPALLSAASTPRSTPRSTPARSVSRTPGPDARRLCSPSRQMAPKFYTYPFNKVVEEGDHVVFQCAAKGLPAPWATWDKDGVIITPSSRITIKEKDEILRILEIEQVTVDDVGVYRVTLENDYGRVEATARLEVITQKGKFHTGVRAYSASPRKSMPYRRRSLSRQD